MKQGYFVFPHGKGLAVTGKFRAGYSVSLNTDIVKYMALVGVYQIDFTGSCRCPVIHFKEGREHNIPPNIVEYLSEVNTHYITHCHIEMVDE